MQRCVVPFFAQLKDSSSMIPAIRGDVMEVFEPEQGHINGNRRWWERLPNSKKCTGKRQIRT